MVSRVAFPLLLLSVVVAQAHANLLSDLLDRFKGTAPEPLADDKPWFCHDRECPSFEVVKKIDDNIELRKYPETKWAGLVKAGTKLELAWPQAYTSLYRYFNGANDQDKKMPSTAPAVTRIKPVNGFRGSEQNYTIAYYLPNEYQEGEPPKPSYEDIKIFTVPAGQVYVASFGGFATEGSILSTAAKLLETIKGEEAKVDESEFYFAAYDPTTRFTNRHNEVWFLPDEDAADVLVRA